MNNKFNVVVSVLCLILSTQTFAVEKLEKTSGNGSVASSGSIETHNAIETDSLRISLDENGSGFVEGKSCDSCKVLRVKITPATKAFAKRVEVPLERAKSRLGQYATVIYELDTKNVSAIRW